MRRGSSTLLALMIAAAAGCAQESSAPAVDRATIELPAELQWPLVDGAVQYRVQVWDGMRLLFEETREDTRLAITEAMQRSMRGAESAQLRVQALGPDGADVGALFERTLAGQDR